MFGSSINPPSSQDLQKAAIQHAYDFLSYKTDELFSYDFYQQQRLGSATYELKCSRSTDCGSGYFCSSGVCVPVGTGNTGTATQGGCSTGPNENGGNGYRDNCGSNSGTNNLGKCASPGCGSGASQSCDGGDRCCRFTASGNGVSVSCWFGSCGESTDPCSNYCTSHRASYGTLATGCDPSNTCSECATCIDQQCELKPLTEAPCHCNPEANANCDREGVPWLCCNYKDSCRGREYYGNSNQRYCHPDNRLGVPSCWDPTITCDAPNSCVNNCTDGISYRNPGDPPFVPPFGCKQTGFIRNEQSGQEAYLYQCCTSGTCNDGSLNPKQMAYVRPVYMLYRWFGFDQGWSYPTVSSGNWIYKANWTTESIGIYVNRSDSNNIKEDPQYFPWTLNGKATKNGTCITSYPAGCGSIGDVLSVGFVNSNGYYSLYHDDGFGMSASNQQYDGALLAYITGYFQFTNNTALGAQYTWLGNPGNA